MDITARHKFLNGIKTFKNALSLDNQETMIMVDTLVDSLHDERARMLRNGLAVIGYSILEDFLKKRAIEVLSQIGTIRNNPIAFNELPERLKKASTINALKGISAEVEKMNKQKMDINRQILFVQEESSKIANTQEYSYELSPFSMGWIQSNLGHEDINQSLTIFGVDGGWEAIREITNLAEVTLARPIDSFKSAASRRHNAAHDADTDSPYDNLLNYVNEATSIAFSFDTLITKSLYFISRQDRAYLRGDKKIRTEDISIRLIRRQGDQWKYFKNKNSPRPIKISRTGYQDLLNSFKNRSTCKDEVLIVKDENNIIVDWELYSFS